MARTTSLTTTDHETIRRWVEERGGWPAEVTSTARGAAGTGIIRVDFPGYSGEGKLDRIEWEDWFRKFDESGLAFVYQDTTAGGEQSNFNKLVARETAEARPGGRRASRRTSAARSGRRAGAARGGRAAARGGKRAAAGAGKRRGAAGRTAAAAKGGRKSAGGSRSTARAGARSTGRRATTGAAAARTTGSRSARGAAGGRGKARAGGRAAGARSGGGRRGAGRKAGGRAPRRSSRSTR